MIALGDLALLVLCLARNAPLLRRSLVLVKNRLLRERRLSWNKVGALQLQRQEEAGVSRERQTLRRSTPRQKANETCREDEQITNFSVPALGSIGSSRDGGHEYVDLPIACATRRWISSGDGGNGAVTVPSQRGRSAIMSQSRSGRLRSGTTPRAWYCPITSAKVTLAFRRRPTRPNEA
jgi:hypothetical protein